MDKSNSLAWLRPQRCNSNRQIIRFYWYGMDWMAFAHLLFAILFYGLYKDPIRNKWLVSFGLVACVAIAPIALGFGHLRGIPLIWQFLDMAFGVIAGALLLRIKSLIQSIEKSTL